MIVLDQMHYMEKKLREPLSHEGGKLLRMLISRLSIERKDWVHTYCFSGDKAMLPKQKKKRLDALSLDRRKLHLFIDVNQPCVVVGLGRLACEILTGASLINSKAGTCWTVPKLGRVWICYGPDAALYDPGMAVEIYGILAKAAEAAGIETKFNREVAMFDWGEFV